MDTAPNLGFLTIVEENHGYLGGYLLTNSWGRPLEFRLSTAVQPNRVQQILYGSTLKPYLYADLIGKTLVEKCSIPADLVITDCQPALDLRLHVSMPVVWMAPPADGNSQALDEANTVVERSERHLLHCHAEHLADALAIRAILETIDCPDLAEPFARIREALAEARKLGATHRAA